MTGHQHHRCERHGSYYRTLSEWRGRRPVSDALLAAYKQYLLAGCCSCQGRDCQLIPGAQMVDPKVFDTREETNG